MISSTHPSIDVFESKVRGAVAVLHWGIGGVRPEDVHFAFNPMLFICHLGRCQREVRWIVDGVLCSECNGVGLVADQPCPRCDGIGISRSEESEVDRLVTLLSGGDA